MSTEKERAIFVVGPESSGTTMIARILNMALIGQSWSGRGWNCCDDGQCDAPTYTAPCRPVEHIVCHRSLPFRDKWPPVDEWLATYDCRFIVCTRDQNIARTSQRRRWRKSPGLLDTEGEHAVAIIRQIMNSAPCFIWSYETFMLLQEPYLENLFAFLGISNHYPVALKLTDANRKYIRRGWLPRLAG